MDGTSKTWDCSVTVTAVDCGIFSSCPTVDGTSESRTWDYSVTIIAVDTVDFLQLSHCGWDI